jgi:hypothetical protein
MVKHKVTENQHPGAPESKKLIGIQTCPPSGLTPVALLCIRYCSFLPQEGIMQNQPPRINIRAEKASGVYANIAIVNTSQAEFVLDFARIMPGLPAAELECRVIMSPHRIKGFIGALKAQVDMYEKRFGPLEDSVESAGSIGFQVPQTSEVKAVQ